MSDFIIYRDNFPGTPGWTKQRANVVEILALARWTGQAAMIESLDDEEFKKALLRVPLRWIVTTSYPYSARLRERARLAASYFDLPKLTLET